MKARAEEKIGGLLAASLAGAWREESPKLVMSRAEFASLAPLLCGSGAAGLAWRRVRNTSLAGAEGAEGLRQTYLLNVVSADAREVEIGRLFALLNSERVGAVLVKGWAAGRAYPEQGLRPSGDIDVCVRPEEYAKAKEILSSPEGGRFWVDLHEGFGRLIDRSAEELFGRSQVIKVGGTDVRVLCEEDHLRLLCRHLFGHGAWRPLWLCDVAAAIESRGEGFDWERLLGRCKRGAELVERAAGLAQILLGARVEGTPLADAAERIPAWLTRAVLRHWERPYASAHESPPLMRSYFRKPSGILGALRRRWPDPIRATVYFNVPFNEFPRLPFQLGSFVGQSARYLLRLPEELRQVA